MSKEITDYKILFVKWFTHYDDEHLVEEYTKLETLINKNTDTMHCIADGSKFSVYAYSKEIHKEVIDNTSELFDPEFHDNFKAWKEEYYEHEEIDPQTIDFPEFIADLEYQWELGEIMSASGGDEHEFARLWCERF